MGAIEVVDVFRKGKVALSVELSSGGIVLRFLKKNGELKVVSRIQDKTVLDKIPWVSDSDYKEMCRIAGDILDGVSRENLRQPEFSLSRREQKQLKLPF